MLKHIANAAEAGVSNLNLSYGACGRGTRSDKAMYPNHPARFKPHTEPKQDSSGGTNVLITQRCQEANSHPFVPVQLVAGLWEAANRRSYRAVLQPSVFPSALPWR